MKVRTIFGVAALCLLGAAGAQAETYQGVHPLTNLNSRGAVQAEAVTAAHGPNPYATGYGADIPAAIVSSADPAAVHTEAVAAARGPEDPYPTPEANAFAVTASSTDPTAVHAQAVAAAHRPDPFWSLWQPESGGSGSDSRTAMLR